MSDVALLWLVEEVTLHGVADHAYETLFGDLENLFGQVRVGDHAFQGDIFWHLEVSDEL